jgi:hypothetical protein
MSLASIAVDLASGPDVRLFHIQRTLYVRPAFVLAITFELRFELVGHDDLILYAFDVQTAIISG